MSHLVDTNIISEVRKGERCDQSVAEWWATVADEDIYLSVLCRLGRHLRRHLRR